MSPGSGAPGASRSSDVKGANGVNGVSGRCEQPFLLLVDDEQAFAEALAFRLESRGLPCLTAGRGEDALALLDRRELEVILLDLNMPGMHGLDVLKAVKAARPDVEVLLLTGEADLAVAATGMRRGAGDYLVKPVDFEALLASLEKARKRAREHRERLRAAEAGKLMALGALAAGVGHEINNPLQIILQRSEWLQELLEDAQKGQAEYPEMIKSARIIQAQARRAGEITAQLLDLARTSRQGSAEADPGEIIRRVAACAQSRADELGAALVVDLAPDLPRLPCSAAELEPVISHLLRNALDAVEAAQAGSRPENSPRREACGNRREVAVSARPQPGGIRMEVRDTGEGVAADMVPYIFDPFFSLRPVGKGTGLGLTVCHSIVTALRGAIQYAPAPGGGALFTVDLPAGQDAGGADKAAPQQPKG